MAKKDKPIRLPQPVNANNALSAEHTIYVATSQGGKTTAVKKLGRIKATDQVLFFDPFGDYANQPFQGRKVRSYDDWTSFLKAVVAGRKTGQGFKIAKTFKYEATPEDMDLFCQIAWALGDGTHAKSLHVVLEEFAELSRTSAKADGYSGKIVRVGRKFGVVAHTLFQRGQEVPNTVLSNAPYKWVGMQETSTDCAYLAEKTGVPMTEIQSLGKLEYVLKKPGNMNNWSRGSLLARTKHT